MKDPDEILVPVLSPEEVAILRDLKVPVPDDEARRLNVLRETQLLDSNQSDPDFDRYTSLAKRIFNVRCSTNYYCSLVFF
jgi:hypothetical protein